MATQRPASRHESYELDEQYHRTPDTDSPNPRSSIEHRLITIVLALQNFVVRWWVGIGWGCLVHYATPGHQIMTALASDRSGVD